jgi:hypothetical protein
MVAIRSLLLLSLLALSGFAQSVNYNFDRNADFSKFKTYKWVVIKDAVQLNQLTDQQLKTAVDAELAKKGLVKTEGDNADLLIGYQAAIKEDKQYNAYSTGGPSWGYGPGWGRGYGYAGPSNTTVQTTTIHIGQLALDMYDAPEKKLVWRGEASKTLDENAKPEKRQKNLKKGVEKLLKNYPPPVKK